LNISDVGKKTSLSINDLAKLYPTLVRVVKGGIGEQGTWLQEDVAIEFARWLSPKFAIWCNDRIKELVNNGSVVLSEEQQILNVINILQKRIEESQLRLDAANNTISEMKSDYDYMENLVKCEGSYTLTWIAKDLGMRSVKVLVDKLLSNKIFYRQSGTLLPYAMYSDKGYFVKQSRNYLNKAGKICESFDTRVTENGRLFLHKVFDSLI
jgi:phage antirepressor YoqD-like protein